MLLEKINLQEAVNFHLRIMLLSFFLPVLGLKGLLLVLLIPYIGHYYTLENEVQKMYQQYDEILIHIRAKKEHTK